MLVIDSRGLRYVIVVFQVPELVASSLTRYFVPTSWT